MFLFHKSIYLLVYLLASLLISHGYSENIRDVRTDGRTTRKKHNAPGAAYTSSSQTHKISVEKRNCSRRGEIIARSSSIGRVTHLARPSVPPSVRLTRAPITAK